MKVEQSRKSLVEAERIPNLGVEFGADFNAPPDFQTGGRGQLSMELPLFARNQGEIAQSIANGRALGSALEAKRRAVAAKVASSYFDLESRRTQVQLYRDTLLPSSRQLEQLAEESYRRRESEYPDGARRRNTRCSKSNAITWRACSPFKTPFRNSKKRSVRPLTERKL